MKQSLKYCILIVLAVLLHSMVAKAAVLSCTMAEFNQEECFISQSHPATTRNVFERFYLFCSSMPCEMGHADVSHIPTDKFLLHLVACFREHKDHHTSPSASSLLLNIHSLSDPVTYYVYGLRKIII